MLGKRCLEMFLLCGPILSVWSQLQDILHTYDKTATIQVVRLKTTKGQRLVGKFQNWRSVLSTIFLKDLKFLKVKDLSISGVCFFIPDYVGFFETYY